MDSQLRALHQGHTEERLRVGSFDLHGPGLSVPVYCYHMDVKRQEAPVRKLSLPTAQPRQPQPGDERGRQCQEAIESDYAYRLFEQSPNEFRCLQDLPKKSRTETDS